MMLSRYLVIFLITPSASVALRNPFVFADHTTVAYQERCTLSPAPSGAAQNTSDHWSIIERGDQTVTLQHKFDGQIRTLSVQEATCYTSDKETLQLKEAEGLGG